MPLSGQPVDFLPWAPWMGPTICLTLSLTYARGRDGTKHLNQNSVCQNTKQISTRKTIGCFAETISCLYQFSNIKTEFKEIKDRENAQRDLYWFTLNLELHLVFPENTREST